MYAAYQKKLSQPTPPMVNPDELEPMTSAVTRMAEVMQGSKPRASGLERLSVPTWDGSRRSYHTWKKDQIGVKPTKFCTCTDNELRENKFVRSLSETTTLVDGKDALERNRPS